jgi:hypothetical protein
MKRIIGKTLLIITLITAYSTSLNAQILFSNNDATEDPHASAILEIRADDAGLILPNVTLSEVDGVITATGIAATPADGLIIFHDGSNQITKGIWYYDADLPGWYMYSDYSSDLLLEVENFGEMFEATSLGNGTLYNLDNAHFTPWSSATVSLEGLYFSFLPDETVTTETGSALADQIQVNGGNAIYTINISTTFLSTTSYNDVTGKLYVNDTPVEHIFFRHSFQTKDAHVNCYTSGNVELHDGDRLDFRFQTTTASEGIKIEHLNFRLVKIGEL